MTTQQVLMGQGAVIVAHPDDECLWASAVFGCKPGTHAICCTIPRKDPERIAWFALACAELGAVPLVVPVVEPAADEPLDHLSLLQLEDMKYDWVVTHNERGEYGHRHHQDVHWYVRDHAPRGARVFAFGYGLPAEGPRITMHVDMDFKLRALRKYNHTSKTDTAPKWQALLSRYPGTDRESLVPVSARPWCRPLDRS